MASVNKVIVLGNVGRDPEIRYSSNGDAICNVSIATTEKWKDKDGEKQEKTEWHRVVFFGRQAEIVEQYVKKGSPLYVEGRLQTRKYEKDGQDHYATEIVGMNLRLLGNRPTGESGESDERPRGSPQRAAGAGKSNNGSRGAPQRKQDDFDDDIPF